MKTFKTKAGTELPLQNLKGKDYLLVAHRLVWFREEHPTWSIITHIIESNEKFITAKAFIKDESGRNVQTGHKTEHYAHFADALEKAETGAVGRALAMLGYGTQFAPEFDEEERIVDSPVERPKPTAIKSPSPIKPISQEPQHVWKAAHKELQELKDLAKAFQWQPNEVTDYMRAKYKVEGIGKLTESQYSELKFTIRNMTPSMAKAQDFMKSPEPLFTADELKDEPFKE